MEILHRIWKIIIHFGMAFAVVVIVGSVASSNTESMAKSRVRLSFSKKTYRYVGCEDKLKLKGVRSGARVKWRTSNSSIIKVLTNRKNYVWFGVKKEGEAIITATYRGKKYKCRISIKKPGLESGSGNSDPGEAGNDSGGGMPGTSDIENGGEESTTPEQNMNDTTADPSPSPSPDPTTGNGDNVDPDKPASTTSPLYVRVMDDFVTRSISDDMSEYRKMDVICRFVASFQYEAYQSDWTQMLETGSGDCYSARIVVMTLARRVGLRAAACMSYDAHGECIVKADGIIYMTTTGYEDDYYQILKMDEESFRRKATENHISISYFGY